MLKQHIPNSKVLSGARCPRKYIRFQNQSVFRWNFDFDKTMSGLLLFQLLEIHKFQWKKKHSMRLIDRSEICAAFHVFQERKKQKRKYGRGIWNWTCVSIEIIGCFYACTSTLYTLVVCICLLLLVKSHASDTQWLK